MVCGVFRKLADPSLTFLDPPYEEFTPSVVASTVLSKTPALPIGAFALAVLYAIQFVVSRARRASRRITALVDNKPRLLMVGNRILHQHLAPRRE